MFESVSHIINHPWIYYLLMGFYVLTIAAIIGVVLSENRNPVKSLAWVTVLLLLPVVGIVLYIFFGRSIKNTRMISRRNRRKLRKQDQGRPTKMGRNEFGIEAQQQVHLGRNLSGASYYTDNDIEIFTNGVDKFEQLLKDIERAKTFINLQYYIISADAIGQRVKEALIRKANQGVTVRVIYDHVGSFDTPNRYFKEMRDAGVQVYPFFKVVFPFLGTRVNWRNHRKICVIDGEIGYIGGMNIADRYLDGGKHFKRWRDTHIRITGPAVGALQYSFAVDWNFMGQPLIEDNAIAGPIKGENLAGMQLLTSGPTSQWTNIAFLFIKSIATAKKRVFLQTPYFLPNDALLQVLQTAALSGIDVRVMMPRHSDSAMLTAASFSYISECLKAGVKVYLYEDGMLHSKILLVDDEFVSIGSTNFDFRSFEHNFEANMQVYSKSVNAQMADIFREDLKLCHRVLLNEWKKRPLVRRAFESIIRLLSPIL